jgi:hypothetical protein
MALKNPEQSDVKSIIQVFLLSEPGNFRSRIFGYSIYDLKDLSEARTRADRSGQRHDRPCEADPSVRRSRKVGHRSGGFGKERERMRHASLWA